MERKLKIVSCLVFFLFLLINCPLNVEAINITTNNETYSGDSSYKKVTNHGNFKIYTNTNSHDTTNFRLYKIVNIYYNSVRDEIKYGFTTNFQTFLNSSDCPSTFRAMTIEIFMSLNKGTAIRDQLDGNNYVVSGGNLTSNDFARLMSAYAGYVREHTISTDGYLSMYSLSTSGRPYKMSDYVEAGTHLALPDDSIGADYGVSVFGVMVDSVRLEKNGSTWELKDAEILAKTTTTSLSHQIAANYQGPFNLSADVGYGGSPEGKILFAIPTYPANSLVPPMITVTIDKVRNESGWLTFVTSGFSISDMSSTGGTIKYNNQTVGTAVRNSSTGQVKVKFTSISLIPKTIEFKYHAESLNSINSVMGANKRNAKLEFSDPYTSSETVAINTAESRDAIFYTYALQITGTNGAVFKITDSSGVSKGTITIGSDGIGELKGLKSGTYTVTQTKAPAGYALISDSQTVKVGTGGTQVSGKTGYYNITMRNSILLVLPFTGSKGTIIFSIIGSLLIIVSIIFLIKYKKKKNKVNQNTTTN